MRLFWGSGWLAFTLRCWQQGISPLRYGLFSRQDQTSSRQLTHPPAHPPTAAENQCAPPNTPLYCHRRRGGPAGFGPGMGMSMGMGMGPFVFVSGGGPGGPSMYYAGEGLV